MSTVLVFAGIFLCLCLSNFCSASEMAFSSCNVMRLENARDDGSSARRSRCISQSILMMRSARS